MGKQRMNFREEGNIQAFQCQKRLIFRNVREIATRIYQ